MAPPTPNANDRPNGNGRLKSQQALEQISSKQILSTLRAWQSESKVIDPKVLLKALRGFRKGNFTVRLPDNQTGIAGEIAIKIIYTSEKRRTRQTGGPIAQALDIPLEIIPRREVGGLVDRLRTQHPDDAIVIVSHSRTIPTNQLLSGRTHGVLESRPNCPNSSDDVPSKRADGVGTYANT